MIIRTTNILPTELRHLRRQTTEHDRKVIKRIIKANKRNRLFAEFMPCPPEHYESKFLARNEKQAKKMEKKYGARDHDDWCCQNWGRNWDEEVESDGISLSVISSKKIGLYMCTAWTTPWRFLDHLVDLGCHVSCISFEPCDWYLGIYRDKILWKLEDDLGKNREDIEPAVEKLLALVGGVEANSPNHRSKA